MHNFLGGRGFFVRDNKIAQKSTVKKTLSFHLEISDCIGYYCKQLVFCNHLSSRTNKKHI